MILRGNSVPDLLFVCTLLLALIVLLGTSWHAPMSGDEYVHVKQAEKNINYLTTFGRDKAALDTPISRLKHYGQSFDTATVWIGQLFSINDLYRFRHLANAVVAWILILFTSLVSMEITKSRWAGIITIALFLATNRFMGHAMNNLKDIPFACAYVFSLYFIFRFIKKLPKISWRDLAALVIGMAFGISIRIGGVLIFTYFLLFVALYIYFLFVSEIVSVHRLFHTVLKLGLVSCFVFFVSFFLGILLWPWALESPLTNPIESLELMHHYPTTVRQIFEGKLFWSDHFPWYYLFKYLLITLPLIILLGFLLFFVFVWKLRNKQGIVLSIFTLIAFGFPLFYTSATGANVYGGWRQMLFILPPLVILSSIGIWMFFKVISVKKYLFMSFLGLNALLVYFPIRFLVMNYPYQYTYFNELTGGTMGAYGNYELDYYFTSFKKAYEFIDREVTDDPKIIAANFIIPEYYKGKSYRPKLVDYYDRSNADWEYAIIGNTFLNPFGLKEGYWPPENCIFTEQVNGKPIVAVLKRRTTSDLEGKQLLDRRKYQEAIEKFKEALIIDKDNESILLNLARTYIKLGNFQEAENALNHVQKIYPGNEWVTDLRGEVKLRQGHTAEAIELFRVNINSNYKFYHSYVNLAKTYAEMGDVNKAIKELQTCLHINPFYKPAYQVYGKLLIEAGEVALGQKMLNFEVEGDSKYRRK